MKKICIVFLLLVCLMPVFSFANSTDIVATVGDTDIFLDEAQTMYNEYFGQYVKLYQEHNIEFEDKDRESLRDAIVEMLVTTKVLMQKAEEHGFDIVTENDKIELYDRLLIEFEANKEEYGIEHELTPEEVQKTLEEQGVTIEAIYAKNLEDLPFERVYQHYTQDVEGTEEEKQEVYLAKLAEWVAEAKAVTNPELIDLYPIIEEPEQTELSTSAALTSEEDTSLSKGKQNPSVEAGKTNQISSSNYPIFASQIDVKLHGDGATEFFIMSKMDLVIARKNYTLPDWMSYFAQLGEI